jgi:hypothetical protein
MLDRLGRLLDADEFQAALSVALAATALHPAIRAAYAAHRAEWQREQEKQRGKRKPPAAASFRKKEAMAGSGRTRPIPGWIPP